MISSLSVWRYSLVWTLASSTFLLQFYRSLVFTRQPQLLILLRSSSFSVIHRFHGRSCFFPPKISSFRIFLDNLLIYLSVIMALLCSAVACLRPGGGSEGIVLCKVVLSHTQPGRRHIPANSGYEPDRYVNMSSCTP